MLTLTKCNFGCVGIIEIKFNKFQKEEIKIFYMILKTQNVKFSPCGRFPRSHRIYEVKPNVYNNQISFNELCPECPNETFSYTFVQVNEYTGVNDKS